jgi:hypothetical protein
MLSSSAPPPLRPAHQPDAIGLHERLGLQILQGGIGIFGPVAPHRDPLRARRAGLAEAARARAVHREHDISLNHQRAHPGPVDRQDAATLVEQAGAAVHQHQRRPGRVALGTAEMRGQIRLAVEGEEIHGLLRGRRRRRPRQG